MKDIFVSKEIAKKLKEIGFNEPCMAYYLDNETYNGLYATNIETDDGFALLEDILAIDNHNSENDNISAPTYEQVFKWFIEKEVDSSITLSKPTCEDGYYYGYFIMDFRNCYGGYDGKVGGGFDTYEQAREQLILKLIEIYQEK